MEGYGLTETSPLYPLMICEMGFRVGTVGRLLKTLKLPLTEKSFVKVLT
jgi:long-subunit acyl-CoA synthetase (AMP-forming)